MKTNKFKNQYFRVITLVSVFFLVITTVNAQNLRCTNRISDLTDQQKTKIRQLHDSHQTEMKTIRQQILDAATIEKKAEISKQMIDKRTAHLTGIRNLLTDGQKKEFDQFALNKGFAMGKGAGKGNGCGYGNGRGNGRGNGYGYGNGNGRGNGCGNGYGRGNRQGRGNGCCGQGW